MSKDTPLRPTLQHVGLTTVNIDAMIEWYANVLGMTINHRSIAVPGSNNAAPQSVAMLSNDAVNHRIALYESANIITDPDKSRRAGLQHVAFAYETLDDLLETYARLRRVGILPALAVDQGVQTAFYYGDPERNVVELNACNYDDEQAATERLRTSPPMHAYVVDPEKMIDARKAGLSNWELHALAVAGDLAPDTDRKRSAHAKASGPEGA